ncbi:MAG TPA: branched chain amino acid aminotransferase, partial [Candidatus Parcubacteria bacterium]|nr:branched chain amino acid aminotransferase [Candidatus Parcubacteria bacterium]
MKKIKFPKTKKIWLNGKLIDWEKAEIHILAHALHYGSAVFEGIRVYETKNGPAVFRLKDHIHRFFNSAKILKMKFPFSKKEIEEAVLKTVRVNKLNQGYIRPIAFYGYGKMGLDPQGAPLNIAIICWPWGAYLGKKETIKVKTSAYRRLPPFSCPMEAKVSGYYVNSILATFEARDKGYDEALLLDYQNYI